MIETYRLNHKKNNTTGSIIVLEIKTEEKKKVYRLILTLNKPPLIDFIMVIIAFNSSERSLP